MVTGLRQGFPKIRGADVYSDPTGNVRAGCGYPQAGLAVHLAQAPWSNNVEALVFGWEFTNPLENPVKEAMLLFRRGTQRLAHSFRVSCVP